MPYFLCFKSWGLVKIQAIKLPEMDQAPNTIIFPKAKTWESLRKGFWGYLWMKRGDLQNQWDLCDDAVPHEDYDMHCSKLGLILVHPNLPSVFGSQVLDVVCGAAGVFRFRMCRCNHRWVSVMAVFWPTSRELSLISSLFLLSTDWLIQGPK